MPKRSHSSIVCAKSRAVTRTSWPSARRHSISGRITSTCGLFVRSIQTRIGRHGNGRGQRECVGAVSAGSADRRYRWPALLVLASISETLVNETSHFVRDAGLPGSSC